MHKQVFINVEETMVRVAIVEDGVLSELFIEEFNDQTIVGNIYRGIVEDVVPGLKAAFINIGLDRRAFLHFDDFCRESLFLNKAQSEKIGQATKAKSDVSSEKKSDDDKSSNAAGILKRGMPIMVQVTKDEIGQKSPRVTSFVTLPGRYLVLLPFKEMEGGVSKKIADRDERLRLKKILNSLRSKKVNFIIRTAGCEQEEDNIRNDTRFLKKEWNRIVKNFQHLKVPSIIYNDHDIFYRLIRDVFTSDINEILVDDYETMQRMRKILKILIHELKDTPKYYDSQKNIFDIFDIERQVYKATRNKVWLKSGGFIVFDEMEALTAIDVNTGRFVGSSDQEKTILKTNLEAAKLIAEQIRLRDIGGLIVIDFIDMLENENKVLVEKELRKYLKGDRAKMAISRIGDFGLLEMTRKRVRESLRNVIMNKCPYCDGSGKILNNNEIYRRIKYSIIEKTVSETKLDMIIVILHNFMKKYIEDNFLKTIRNIEKKSELRIEMIGSDEIHIEHFEIKCVEKKNFPENIKLLERKNVNKKN